MATAGHTSGALLLATTVSLSACHVVPPEPDEKVFTIITMKAPTRKKEVRAVIEKRLKLAGLNGKVTDGQGDALSIEIVGGLRYRKVLDIMNPATAAFSRAEIANCPFAAIIDPDQLISACSSGGSGQSAKTVDDPVFGEMVVLSFTPAGQTKWISLTREAFNNENGNCSSAALGDASRCRVATMFDRRLVSAPEVLGVSSPAKPGSLIVHRGD